MAEYKQRFWEECCKALTTKANLREALDGDEPNADRVNELARELIGTLDIIQDLIIHNNIIK